jgi:hypothetical protein
MLFQLPLLGAQNDAEWRNVLLQSRVDLHREEAVKLLAQIRETLAPDLGRPAWGLVLRVPTGIVADLNFFLQRSLGGGQQFSPEHLTTKILRAGVYFENYPAGVGRLSETPFVYLIPAGTSVMRSPVSTLPSLPKPLRLLHLVDQLMPRVLPDFLDQATGLWRVDDLDEVATDPDWRPAGENLGRVRKFNPFVAGNSRNPQSQLSYSGLVGRTAWNTEWLLVIPGRTLGAVAGDSELGTRLFIDNVTDIVLRFETYSYENPF